MKVFATVSFAVAGAAVGMKSHVEDAALSVVATDAGVSGAAEEVRNFGNPDCPCIGIDNLEGKTLALTSKGYVDYPADLGSRCEAWDAGVNPDCKGDAKGKGWCAEKWCYVDPRKCKNIEVLPKMSSYVPTARYQNVPVFYSYNTCGSKDLWAKTNVKSGKNNCRCIGFDNLAGSFRFNLGTGGTVTKMATYPGETGGTCAAWDAENNPDCAVKGPNRPAWCDKKWCFVDPCDCDLDEIPKISAYMYTSKMGGKNVYYSYESCGEVDVFTASMNKVACVNIKDQETCNRDMKCQWATDNRCVGSELAEPHRCGNTLGPKMRPLSERKEKLNKEMVQKLEKAPEKGSAASLRKPVLALVAAPLAWLFA
eukprot:TRINITY_DN93458_c0_g1_i1.p1 TRINITY_DN93458_c0_g1~~TRINITY_DN93458_c0_g1_i1.p1  ORF type:complete len:367 (-),score=97.61 TRINITY_DN93458_c0_g1_i1:88-1188(-)